jgi:hypothetical protein
VSYTVFSSFHFYIVHFISSLSPLKSSKDKPETWNEIIYQFMRNNFSFCREKYPNEFNGDWGIFIEKHSSTPGKKKKFVGSWSDSDKRQLNLPSTPSTPAVRLCTGDEGPLVDKAQPPCGVDIQDTLTVTQGSWGVWGRGEEAPAVN